MSKPVLILGKSGSGKSTATRTLPPVSTFMINVIGKDLPFRGARKMYTPLTKDGKGNMLSCDDYSTIDKTLKYIDEKRTEIKVVVIDDSQYLMVNEFMRRHSTQGKGNDVFQLYNEIGDHFWNLIWNSRILRQDLIIYFLHHAEETDGGYLKAKSIGKMLDDKVDIPGMFTIVLLARNDGDRHYFETTNKGFSPSKSPAGMFESDKIDNDLNLVTAAINNYEKGE